MAHILMIVLVFILAFMVLALLWKLIDTWTPNGIPASLSTPAVPQIIVNVPADWKPMPTIPPTTIEGAKAQLWYSVYKAGLDSSILSTNAAYNADAAVEACFP